jgi:hypothetical protein
MGAVEIRCQKTTQLSKLGTALKPLHSFPIPFPLPFPIPFPLPFPIPFPLPFPLTFPISFPLL